MKRIFLFCFFVIIVFSGNAQSKNPMIFGDALVKGKKMQRAGTVLTVVGGVTLFAGNIMYWKVYNDDGSSESQEDKVDRSVKFIIGGLGLMAVGIPLLVIGRTKERDIRIEARLSNYNGSASISGIGLKIRF